MHIERMQTYLISAVFALVVVLPSAQSDDCIVPVLYHGDIKELQIGDYYWNWKVFRYDRQITYVKISAGSVLPRGSTVKLFCHTGYSFQGTSIKSQEITCFEGKWLPDPVCLRVGQKYIPRTTTLKPSTTTLSTTEQIKTTMTASTEVSRILETTTHGITTSDCIVPVLYHSDIKELKIGDYYWNWKVFRYDRQKTYVKISAGSILPHGSSVNLFCHTGYSFQGTSIKSQGITCFKGKWLPDPVCLRVGQKYIPRTTTLKPSTTTLLTTEQIKSTMSISTEVSEILRTSTHGITTNIKCKELVGNDLMRIFYTNDRKIGSKATFHCFAPGRRSGASFADCLENGTWSNPTPTCRIGQKYIPRTTTLKPSTTTLSTTEQMKTTMSTSTEVSKILETTTRGITIKEIYETIEDKETPAESERPSKEECYCDYPINDENLIAHADGKLLNFRDKVKNGSVVVFRCKYVGFHRLDGNQNIKCEDCRNWYSSEFPACSEPKRGNAVIIFDNKLHVSIEGNLEARKGQNIKLMCATVESAVYPHWRIPSENGVAIKRERRERESFGDVLYVSHLVIENADIENEGPYGCAVENNTMNIVNLIIDDPNVRCPEFPVVDGISVTYDMERRVKSKAVFACTKSGQEIDGKGVLTCQRNGEWSGVSPQCTDIKCKELVGNDLMRISYTNDRKIGSKATFYCFAPGRRSRVSFADCLENGTWSNPTPTCRIPPCLVEDISSDLPENVVLDMEDANKTVPYNATIKLTCAEDLIVKNDAVAKCSRTGHWIIGNIQCVSGCSELVKDPDSSLIIIPQKNIYKLGEMVTFLCPPGMRLTTQSQLIMCLKNGWSETILPDCQQKVN